MIVRPVEDGDYHRLVNLIHFEAIVHRHLDWLAPLDWLQYEPFMVACVNENLVGALSCPVDPSGIAWIRLFGVTSDRDKIQIWNKLWFSVQAEFQGRLCPMVAALPLHGWFTDLLIDAGFREETRVVFLACQSDKKRTIIPDQSYNIRPMTLEDIGSVAEVDLAAFEPMWTNSQSMLAAAFQQSTISSVAQDLSGRIVGYQISTSGHLGGHLARLAVLPDCQGKRIGSALVADLLDKFAQQNIHRISVNTQENNIASIKLYTRLGFHFTGESYPVFKFELKKSQ